MHPEAKKSIEMLFFKHLFQREEATIPTGVDIHFHPYYLHKAKLTAHILRALNVCNTIDDVITVFPGPLSSIVREAIKVTESFEIHPSTTALSFIQKEQDFNQELNEQYLKSMLL